MEGPHYGKGMVHKILTGTDDPSNHGAVAVS